jgi:hypothetical protein
LEGLVVVALLHLHRVAVEVAVQVVLLLSLSPLLQFPARLQLPLAPALTHLVGFVQLLRGLLGLELPEELVVLVVVERLILLAGAALMTLDLRVQVGAVGAIH